MEHTRSRYSGRTTPVPGQGSRAIPFPLAAEGQAEGYSRATRLAFVGAGRLGSSLAQAAARVGYSVTALSSRRPKHRAWLSERLPNARILERPAEAAAHADIVFITASDAAVPLVCGEIKWRPGMAAVHCAGALPVAALDAAARAGVPTGGFHPLQTFPDPDAYNRLAGVSFATESQDPSLAGWLRTFAQDLGGVSFEIATEHRAAYHASAVMASGLLAGLAGLAAEMWGQFGVPRDRALAHLAPLIESTAQALRERGLPGALTGPYVRGDAQTIAKHLQAMAASSPDVVRAYAAVALAQLPIAAEQGGLSPQARQEIEMALTSALRDIGGELPRSLSGQPSGIGGQR